MRLRIITAVVGIPLLLGIVLSGGWILKLAIGLLTLVGLREFYTAMEEKAHPIKYIGYIFTVIFTFFVFPNDQWYIVFFICFLFVLLLSIIFFHQKYNIIDVAVTFIGFFYVSFLFFYVLKVRNSAYGEFFVWLIFISAWGSDTFAYFTGITLGKHKLCPKLSPKKTVEGALGGIAGGFVLSFVYGMVITYFTKTPIVNFPIICSIIGGIGAMISQLGDLTASSIKRCVNIKDYGKFFPGHGGVLDRFDSILFTAPFVYYFIIMLNLII
ncbi:phosphatidate cytidylyltransferase [Defluviitalea raffinosedens]|uniref:Phosphatidate cytidylyltransferase n=1 Tax=Defluviitalea raffinosedens TaxID=1450156 RepID=A0A7C8HH40_9FIRM|nr:phosphatidate cytidylyltransferase [Defluviitalea raffinosedens]KAE9637072.1 phosphatidate cytidylyltransferase [Defluviitalea raffinosedens]